MLASGKRVQTGSKAHEATRRLWLWLRLSLNIKSHAEESWFVNKTTTRVWQCMAEYGSVWCLLWQPQLDFNFNVWLRLYNKHFANTNEQSGGGGKRCAAVTSSSTGCGRVVGNLSLAFPALATSLAQRKSCIFEQVVAWLNQICAG